MTNVLDRKVIQAYPNPVRDILSIQYRTSTNDPVNISILELSGVRVFTIEVEVVQDVSRRLQETELDLSTLLKGIYILEVVFDGIPYYLKVVIE